MDPGRAADLHLRFCRHVVLPACLQSDSTDAGARGSIFAVQAAEELEDVLLVFRVHAPLLSLTIEGPFAVVFSGLEISDN